MKVTPCNVYAHAYPTRIIICDYHSSIPCLVPHRYAPLAPWHSKSILDLIEVVTLEESHKLFFVIRNFRIGGSPIEPLHTLKIGPHLNCDMPSVCNRECFATSC